MYNISRQNPAEYEIIEDPMIELILLIAAAFAIGWYLGKRRPKA
jgi:hypothetical protein